MEKNNIDVSLIIKIKKKIDSLKLEISELDSLINSCLPKDENGNISDDLSKDLESNKIIDDKEGIIEGVFDGESMIDVNNKKYPVSVNYASKSKLVVGQRLKLTIQSDGRFLYKQIIPIEKIFIPAVLTCEGDDYSVITEDSISYKVLFASVSYFHLSVGDKVTIILPKSRESDWAAIDGILPV